jgi:hypothetical protein
VQGRGLTELNIQLTTLLKDHAKSYFRTQKRRVPLSPEPSPQLPYQPDSPQYKPPEAESIQMGDEPESDPIPSANLSSHEFFRDQ